MTQITLHGFTLTHGMKEMRELCRITGRDILKGEHWFQALNMENLFSVLAVLARRAHPDTSEAQLEDTLPGEFLQEFLELAPTLMGVKQASPEPPNPSDSEHSVDSPSA